MFWGFFLLSHLALTHESFKHKNWHLMALLVVRLTPLARQFSKETILNCIFKNFVKPVIKTQFVPISLVESVKDIKGNTVFPKSY